MGKSDTLQLTERQLFEPILIAALELAGFVDTREAETNDVRYFGLFPKMNPLICISNERVNYFAGGKYTYAWTTHDIKELIEHIRKDLAADDEEQEDQTLYSLEMIAAERWRQINTKGYDNTHDAKYKNGELIKTAVVYLAKAVGFHSESLRDLDPVCNAFDELATGEEMLVKAAALIAAELDRIKCQETKQLVILADEITNIRKFESDREALDLLMSRGINVDRGFIVITRELDDDEGAAVGYLCAEWDYDTRLLE